jgi:hypothetical protein
MTPAIQIAIIMSAVTLVGMAGLAVNYSPAPAHAVKDTTCKFVAPPHLCFTSRKDCDQYASSLNPPQTCRRL